MKTINLNWFDRQAVEFEEKRFAAMVVMIGIQSCLGSIAAGFSYSNDTIYNLAICATFTMMNNAVLLAQGPAKWCVGVFYAGILANCIVILIHIL